MSSTSATQTGIQVDGDTAFGPGTNYNVYILNSGSYNLIGSGRVGAPATGSTANGSVSYTQTVPYYDNPTTDNVLFYVPPASFRDDGRYITGLNVTVAEAAPCYATGTCIRVWHDGAEADVAVEALAVGDLAVTASGEHRPIRWIGHRTLDPRRHPRPHTVLPVRIRAGALGDDRPARDLVVSPGHSIALDILGEVLVPASSLVNGATAVQEMVDSVTYWHVELDSHDILIAENQPAESYLDMSNRAFFGQGTEEHAVVALHAGPDGDPASRTHADFCRPYHDGGPLVAVVRARMRRRAEALGWRLTAPASEAEGWATTWADMHLEVDGRTVRPKTRGASACFMLPAQARDVWLVSPVGVPREVGDGADVRSLGLCLSGLRLDDGFGERVVALDDPRLSEGFHGAEPGRHWTAGRARLPAALLDGLEGMAFLRLDLAASALPRWTAPEVEARAAAADVPTSSPLAPAA